MLSNSYSQDELLRLAAEVDAGFDSHVFADMFDLLTRYDRDLSPRQRRPASSPPILRRLGQRDPNQPSTVTTCYRLRTRLRPLATASQRPNPGPSTIVPPALRTSAGRRSCTY
jgi:hypothetical protein